MAPYLKMLGIQVGPAGGARVSGLLLQYNPPLILSGLRQKTRAAAGQNDSGKASSNSWLLVVPTDN